MLSFPAKELALPGDSEFVKVERKSEYLKYYGSKLDLLRFIAICSIIWGHTILEWRLLEGKDYSILKSVAQQLGKLGTINFFFISGFFLNKKLDQFNIASYLNYRKLSLIFPWFIFLSIFVAIHSYKAFDEGMVFKGSRLNSFKEVLGFYRDFIVYNAYWYVPVSLITTCTLILFKTHLNKLWFIPIILGCYLFYSANLYHAWVNQLHTKAVFAYIIFMWLGLQTSRNIEVVNEVVTKFSWQLLLILISVMFAIACYEGLQLNLIGSRDPYASLRISNTLLSVLLFIMFLKLPTMKWVKLLKPKHYVFGAYLIQAIIIDQLMPIIRNYVFIQEESLVLIMVVQCTVFLVILGATYLMSVLIGRSRLKFMIGK